MPIITYDSLESVPNDFKSIAKSTDDGKVQINVVPKATVDEFRDSNIQLKKELDAAQTRLVPLAEIVGEDPEAFKAQLNELRLTGQRVKDGELKETRAVEEALNKRTDDMRKDYERQLQAKSADAVAWQKRFESKDMDFRRERVSTAIRSACGDGDIGVNSQAIDDVVNVGLGVFQMTDDNQLVARDGDAIIYGTDGSKSLTPREWLVKLREQKPYFFKSSNGGGAGGDGHGGKIHGVTPADLAKMTPQQKLALANEAAYNRSKR